MRTPAAWLRSCKRREPGIYLYRTRRHLQPWRTEWGYAGKSKNLNIRELCHKGECRRHSGCIEKPWHDLVIYRWKWQLPWWMGWDWILLPLETLMIWLVRPRYNTQKNPRRDKVRPAEQAIQRRVRDGAPTTYRARVARIRLTNLIIRYAAIIMIVTGIGGYLWGRI